VVVVRGIHLGPPLTTSRPVVVVVTSEGGGKLPLYIGHKAGSRGPTPSQEKGGLQETPHITSTGREEVLMQVKGPPVNQLREDRAKSAKNPTTHERYFPHCHPFLFLPFFSVFFVFLFPCFKGNANIAKMYT
jgi:hypothetical protein